MCRVWKSRNFFQPQNAYLKLLGECITTEVRNTSCGHGRFASEDVADGQAIAEYDGDWIKGPEMKCRQNKYAMMGLKGDNILEVECQNIFIDTTVFGNDSRYSNYGCKSNSGYFTTRLDDSDIDRMFIFVTRAIKCGEQILTNYMMSTSGESKMEKCCCCTIKCKWVHLNKFES